MAQVTYIASKVADSIYGRLIGCALFFTLHTIAIPNTKTPALIAAVPECR